jgi:hypothetical protein
MPIRIRLTPLRLIIQPIRPNMTPPTINLRARPIPAPQQRQRSLPIARRTLPIKRRRLPNPKCVADLVHRRPLSHVCAVRPEAQVTVVGRFGGGDARCVGDANGFAEGGILCVAGDGVLHGEGDARVGVGLVGRGVGGPGQGPVEGSGGAGGVGCYTDEEGDTHGGWCGVRLSEARVLYREMCSLTEDLCD